MVLAILPFFKSFGMLILIVTCFAFFVAPVLPLVDNATISMLGDQHERYGRIRLWGTIGWGLTSLVAGTILQVIGLKWIFWIYCGLMMLNLLPVLKLQFKKSTGVTPFWVGINSVFTSRQWILFLGIVFIAGIGLSAHSNYLAILMENQGGNKSMIGVALSISTVSEIPLMFFSNVILRKIKSRGLLIVAVTFAGLRCLLYALGGGPIVLLSIQLLHGLTFPALWVAGITFVAENAPPGLGATIQSVFGGALSGIGMAAGSMLGGVLIDLIGLQGMFSVFGLIVFVGLGFYLVLNRQPVGSAKATEIES